MSSDHYYNTKGELYFVFKTISQGYVGIHIVSETRLYFNHTGKIIKALYKEKFYEVDANFAPLQGENVAWTVSCGIPDNISYSYHLKELGFYNFLYLSPRGKGG